MSTLTYDVVARFCMVASLLLFVALFTSILIYVFRIASSDAWEQAQLKALDLGPDSGKLEGRS